MTYLFYVYLIFVWIVFMYCTFFIFIVFYVYIMDFFVWNKHDIIIIFSITTNISKAMFLWDHSIQRHIDK